VRRLAEKLIGLIRAKGPIPVADYVRIALTDPSHGYYMTRDPFGAGGDFVTAPEVSQMFGELIGLFFAQAWEDRGRPARLHLVELGPGRGTLMADMLRAIAQVRPDLIAAADVVLVEASPALRGVQEKMLEGQDVEWVENFSAVADDAPLFLVANEFFDALPCRQLVKTADGWHERMVAEDGGRLVFATGPGIVPPEIVPERLRNAAPGAIFETSPEALALMREIARRIAKAGGAALIVDYGHTESGIGDTLQVVKAHQHVAPLSEPGEADLTFHVDFAALAASARAAGAQVCGPMPQGAFLSALGIGLRAERLKRAQPDAAAEIEAALTRLTDPGAMGTLFKAMAITDGHSRALPGFAC
jgi:SAM-dependent MidA family methyltransferase